MMQSYDLAIVGGGIVGLTLAASLADSDLSIAVIESELPTLTNAQSVGRVSAVSFATRTILEKLNIWSEIDLKRIAPYDSMHVWDEGSAAKIDFNTDQVGCEHLGCIVENDQIHRAVLTVIKKQTNVTLYSPDQLTNIAVGDGDAWLTLKSDNALTAKLVVGADGANSWLRNKVNIPLTHWDYDHHAIVATFHCRWSLSFSTSF